MITVKGRFRKVKKGEENKRFTHERQEKVRRERGDLKRREKERIGKQK